MIKQNVQFKISIVLNIIFFIGAIYLGFKCNSISFSHIDAEKKDIKIVMFGDSITADGDWSNLLQRSDIKKRGFRGFTTSHYRWILEDSVFSYTPKVCFISGGINDIGAGIPLERTKLNYKILIDKFISKNITLIVQSTLYQENNPKSKIQIDSLNNYLVNYCSQKNIRYLDINSKLSSNFGLKKKYSSDGTHLKKEAYKVWSDNIKTILESLE